VLLTCVGGCSATKCNRLLQMVASVVFVVGSTLAAVQTMGGGQSASLVSPAASTGTDAIVGAALRDLRGARAELANMLYDTSAVAGVVVPTLPRESPPLLPSEMPSATTADSGTDAVEAALWDLRAARAELTSMLKDTSTVYGKVVPTSASREASSAPREATAVRSWYDGGVRLVSSADGAAVAARGPEETQLEAAGAATPADAAMPAAAEAGAATPPAAASKASPAWSAAVQLLQGSLDSFRLLLLLLARPWLKLRAFFSALFKPKAPTSWTPLGGGGGYHRMAGRWPPPTTA